VRACHITSDKRYRNPFGATPTGGTIMLAIDVWDEPEATAELRLWTEDEGERLVAMDCETEGDHLHFSVKLTAEQPKIVWYHFNIQTASGDIWRYGARPGIPVGEGDFAYGEPPSFQLTVFARKRGVQPDWYRNSVVYQIFPDRFARGADFEERAASLEEPREGTDRELIEDWDTPPRYKRNEDGTIACWDFYGGTLEGIREHLGYLEDMGITCLYLNPIFQAASPHRYDTGEYLTIDPVLGDEESFKRLCEDAAARGISVILDGVFNHTGDDSRYFNRYGNYPDLGAWQSAHSAYRDWYKIEADGTYSSWWGVANMPDLNEENPDYRHYICGRDGVVRHWLRDGARGWRLDVADELPDDFIVDIKRAELTEKRDAVLIGEVWEDASSKHAYDQLRKYFWGDELDATMNYPWRHVLLHFLTGKATAGDVALQLQTLRENYPRDAFYSELNMLGSHDRARLLTILGNTPMPDTLGDNQQFEFRMDADHRSLAVSRLWCAALMQMTMPGVPCVYYGDEAGMEGYPDPYNRGPYPWGQEDKNCQTIYRNAIALRKAMPVLVDGEFRPFAEGDDVLGYWRWNDEEAVCVLVNRSLSDSHTVHVEMRGEQVSDVVSGRAVNVENGQAEVFLWPLGTSVLYFHRKQRLQKPMPKGMGVIAHITSVPNLRHPELPGTLGAPARNFVDWLSSTGQRYWQVLPVNPTDEWGSPYAGVSAFMGNVHLLEGYDEDPEGFVERFVITPEYRRFCEVNDEWLLPAVTFQAIKELVGEELTWPEWPERYRTWKKSLARRKELKEGVRRNTILQYEFQRQWQELHDYASARGVLIVGDMPMYVAADSVDVWAEPSIFMLGEDGRPAGAAGAPPDNFTVEGQFWGNPTYRWDKLRDTKYSWWMRRFRRMFELYDFVRLDHFLGFSSYYRIPEGKTAKEGHWCFGPGIEFFQRVHARFGELPFIAEDLGIVTPAVRALMAQTGFAGMDVVQFTDYDVRNGYVPKADRIAYTSTHDTTSLLGWVEQSFGKHEAQELTDKIMRSVLASDTDVVIMQLQDALRLGDEARMNKPGTAAGNWTWHATEEQLEASTHDLRVFAEGCNRYCYQPLPDNAAVTVNEEGDLREPLAHTPEPDDVIV
jgi:4-alpha-glucanotransferase